MNMKETPQAMKVNDQYLSVYEYTGKSAILNNIGREVMDAALKEGIKVVWRELPPDIKRENFTQVATYPRTFLDKYFGNDAKYTVIDDATINMIYNRLTALEDKFDQLIEKLDTKQEEDDDDDLPF
jgi:hypothetical protein